MISPRKLWPIRFLALGLTALLALAALPAAPIQAQTAAPAAATPAATGTPAPTRTPAPTPTATPTLTALQARLILAQTHLKSGDYARAAELFAAIANEDRGNPEALKGLQAALDGQTAARATAAAPQPTAAATAPAPAPSFGDAVAEKTRDLGSAALVLLVLIVLLYVIGHGVRWLLFWGREVWLTRGLPLLGRPAVAPGYTIAEFTDAMGIAGLPAAEIVAQALREKLIAWNQLVHIRELPVESWPMLDLGGMGWVRILWNWILPPERGYKVTGLLLNAETGAYVLAIERTALRNHNVERSRTFEAFGAAPEQTLRRLAGEAAKWLLAPADIEASEAVMAGVRAAGAGATAPLSASEVFDQALDLLLPVRQQFAQDAADFADARRRLREAESLLAHLPQGSVLRGELEAVLADLRRAASGTV